MKIPLEVSFPVVLMQGFLQTDHIRVDQAWGNSQSLYGIPMSYLLPDPVNLLQLAEEEKQAEHRSFYQECLRQRRNFRLIFHCDDERNNQYRCLQWEGHFQSEDQVTMSLTEIGSESGACSSPSPRHVNLAARIRHDLKAPLTGILATIDLLKAEHREKHDSIELMTILESSALLVQNLVGDFVELQKISCNGFQPKPTIFSVRFALEQALRVVQPLCRDKNIRLGLLGHESLPKAVYADEQRFLQILINLLTNSVRHTESGQIAIVIHSCEDREGHYHLKLSVDDTGTGIEPGRLQNLLNGERDKGSLSSDSGLGIYIVKELLLMFQGNLDIESQPRKGTSASITLNLSKAP